VKIVIYAICVKKKHSFLTRGKLIQINVASCIKPCVKSALHISYIEGVR
jgi:hypothetical protein